MPSTRSRVVPIAAAALLLGVLWVVVPRILARLFYDDVVWAVNGWFVQYDLTIFLRAGDAVLDGVSPHPSVSELVDDTSYVYPPLLALLMAPLSLLPSGLAASIFTFGGLVALVGALLLLGVRLVEPVELRPHVRGGAPERKRRYPKAFGPELARHEWASRTSRTSSHPGHIAAHRDVRSTIR